MGVKTTSTMANPDSEPIFIDHANFCPTAVFPASLFKITQQVTTSSFKPVWRKDLSASQRYFFSCTCPTAGQRLPPFLQLHNGFEQKNLCKYVTGFKPMTLGSEAFGSTWSCGSAIIRFCLEVLSSASFIESHRIIINS